MGYINKGSTFAVSLLFPALGLLALAARFASHRRKGLALSVDDWLVVPAWVSQADAGEMATADSAASCCSLQVVESWPGVRRQRLSARIRLCLSMQHHSRRLPRSLPSTSE